MKDIPERTWRVLKQREREVVTLAIDLLSWWRQTKQRDSGDASDRPRLNEAAIDSSFVFRFDPVWRPRAGEIRAMARRLLGKPDDLPLSPEERQRCINHVLLITVSEAG